MALEFGGCRDRRRRKRYHGAVEVQGIATNRMVLTTASGTVRVSSLRRYIMWCFYKGGAPWGYARGMKARVR